MHLEFIHTTSSEANSLWRAEHEHHRGYRQICVDAHTHMIQTGPQTHTNSKRARLLIKRQMLLFVSSVSWASILMSDNTWPLLGFFAHFARLTMSASSSSGREGWWWRQMTVNRWLTVLLSGRRGEKEAIVWYANNASGEIVIGTQTWG